MEDKRLLNLTSKFNAIREESEYSPATMHLSNNKVQQDTKSES